MKRLVVLFLVFTSLVLESHAAPKTDCAEFNALVQKTYNFNEAKLSTQQKMAKEKDLNHFWNAVKAKRQQYLPCLRAAIENPKSNPFFRFDGSNLMVDIAPNFQSKALQVRIYSEANLDMVGERRWVSILCQRGFEGFDISAAASRWLSNPEASYTVPEHGDYEVSNFDAALLLYGSMDEAKATPALLNVINQAQHPGRNTALSLLMAQATPEARKALSQLNLTGFSPQAQETVQTFLSEPQGYEPRLTPHTTRAQFLAAFQDILKGDLSKFDALVEDVPDGERDVVAVLKPEDIPLVRKVRRRFTLGGNQHSLSYYDSFTGILLTLISKSNHEV